MWYILNKRRSLPFATTWVNLEDILINEISQTQKDNYHMIPLIWGFQNSQVHRNRINSGCRSWGKGKCEGTVKVYKISIRSPRVYCIAQCLQLTCCIPKNVSKIYLTLSSSYNHIIIIVIIITMRKKGRQEEKEEDI